eukprot:6187166-Pleurochrysis_carterae.AAC.3
MRRLNLLRTYQRATHARTAARQSVKAVDNHCPALYDGPAWIENTELLHDDAQPPETSLDVTIAVRNRAGNPFWQSKSTA